MHPKNQISQQMKTNRSVEFNLLHLQNCDFFCHTIGMKNTDCAGQFNCAGDLCWQARVIALIPITVGHNDKCGALRARWTVMHADSQLRCKYSIRFARRSSNNNNRLWIKISSTKSKCCQNDDAVNANFLFTIFHFNYVVCSSIQ